MIKFKPLRVMKPSTLLTLAMKEKARCEKDPKYEIDMAEWLIPAKVESESCIVCLAGCVMARICEPTLEYGDISPNDFNGTPDGKRTRAYLYAIDYFRIGDVRRGLGLMGRSENEIEKMDNCRMIHYLDSQVGFDRGINALIKRLKRKGL